MELPINKNDLEFLNEQMQEELYVSYARREARKIIRELDHYKISSKINDHIKIKYKDKIASS